MNFYGTIPQLVMHPGREHNRLARAPAAGCCGTAADPSTRVSCRLLRRRKPSQPFSVAPTRSAEVTEDHAPRGAVGGWQGSRRGLGVRDVVHPDIVRSPWTAPPRQGWSAVKPRSTRPASRFGRHRQAGRESPPTERHAMRVAPPRGLRSVASRRGGEKAAVQRAACRGTPRSRRLTPSGRAIRRRTEGCYDNEIWPTCDTEFWLTRRFLTTCRPPTWPPAASRSTCQLRISLCAERSGHPRVAGLTKARTAPPCAWASSRASHGTGCHARSRHLWSMPPVDELGS